MSSNEQRTIGICIVAPKYMTGGQAIEARRILDGFADEAGCRVAMQPIDPAVPSWIARIRGLRTLVRMPLFIAGCMRRFRRADVVHVCTAAFGPFVLTTTPAVLLARAMGKKVILNYRDGRASEHLKSRWVRWVIGRATVLVFPSGYLRDVFRERGFEGRVIFNVVDTARFRHRPRRPLQPVLITSRLLERLYAVENTLRAFRLVRQQVQDARLIVIGGGDQEQRLRGIIHEEGIEGVDFVGAVPHPAVAEFFDRADIFVNSSTADNMPHSIIEAFSSGLPVVTTAVGGIPYIVQHEHNGLLVDVNRPQAMADAVLRLLNDQALSDRLVAQAASDCRNLYSWQSAKSSWRNLYVELAGRVAGATIGRTEATT